MHNFTEITHPSLAISWLLPSLDQVFSAGGDRLDSIRFAIDGQRGLEDKYAFYEGYVYFEPANSDNLTDEARDILIGQGQRFGLTEDEKDHIPAVRRMERNAENLRFQLPMPHNEDGRAQGDWTFVARPGSLRFLFDARHWEPDGAQIHITAQYTNGQWHNVTEIRIDIPEGQEVSLDNPQALLEAHFDPSYFRVKMPTALSACVADELTFDVQDELETIMRSGNRQIVFALPHDSFLEIGQARGNKQG